MNTQPSDSKPTPEQEKQLRVARRYVILNEQGEQALPKCFDTKRQAENFRRAVVPLL